MSIDAFGVDRRGDYFPWCKDNEMIMAQDDLVALFETNNEHFIVVDTRDEDSAGGRIKGALHLPDWSDWCKSIEALNTAIAEKKATVVIFHCMESVRRGPRCARRVYNYFLEEGVEDFPHLKILHGGADRWIRKYYKTDLVEDFDDDYWGFEDYGGESDEDGKGNIPTEKPHTLYTRPVDQHLDADGNEC